MQKMISPTEKALIQFTESLVISALIAALIAIGPLLSGSGMIDWHLVVYTASVTFLFSVTHGVLAYYKQMSPELVSAIETDVNATQKKIPLPTATTKMSTVLLNPPGGGAI